MITRVCDGRVPFRARNFFQDVLQQLFPTPPRAVERFPSGETLGAGPGWFLKNTPSKKRLSIRETEGRPKSRLGITKTPTDLPTAVVPTSHSPPHTHSLPRDPGHTNGHPEKNCGTGIIFPVSDTFAVNIIASVVYKAPPPPSLSAVEIWPPPLLHSQTSCIVL